MFEYQLLSPEEEIEEIYPYRRVWQTLIIELGLLSVMMVGLFFAVGFGFISFGFSFTLELALCLIPLGLFYFFSVRREARAIQPREGLLMLLVLSMIVVNGVSFPIQDGIITPEAWLVSGGFFNRIIGYTLTIGVLVAFTKYAVLRYSIWPQAFRVRVDGIAYSVPVSLGYATVANLRFVLAEEPTLDALAARILVNVIFHVMIGAIIGYFLAEIAFHRVQFYWLALGIFSASFIASLFVAFRRISLVSGLGSRAIGPIGLGLGFGIAILYALSFLIESADARMAAREGVKRIR